MLKALFFRIFYRKPFADSPPCIVCGRPSARAQRVTVTPDEGLVHELYACQNCSFTKSADAPLQKGPDRKKFYDLIYNASKKST